MGIKFGQDLSITAMGPDKDFQVTLTPEMVDAPAISGVAQLPDADVPYGIEAGTVLQVNVEVTGNLKGLSITSSNDEIVRVTGNSLRTVKSQNAGDDPVYLEVKAEYGKRHYPLNIMENDAVASPRKNAGTYRLGSFGDAVTSLTRRLFSQYEPGGAHQDMFLQGSTYRATNEQPVLLINPERMLPQFDLSGVSVSRSKDNPMEESWHNPVVLVSPRHVVSNSHSGLEIGFKVYFRRRDGSLQMATVIGKRIMVPDCGVYILDQDVTGCAFYATLPLNWEEYMPSISQTNQKTRIINGAIPAVVRQANHGDPEDENWAVHNNVLPAQSPRLRIDWVSVMASLPNTAGAITVSLSEDVLTPFHQRAHGGDSGSPGFFLVPKEKDSSDFEPALIFGYFTEAFGPAYPSLSGKISQAMLELSQEAGDARQFAMKTVSLAHFRKF